MKFATKVDKINQIKDKSVIRFENSSFVTNPRKISGSASPDFLRASTLKKDRVLKIQISIQGGKLEKSQMPPSKSLFRVQIRRLSDSSKQYVFSENVKTIINMYN